MMQLILFAAWKGCNILVGIIVTYDTDLDIIKGLTWKILYYFVLRVWLLLLYCGTYMNNILTVINEYSTKVFGHTYDYVIHTYDNYYMGCYGYSTIYYTVIDNVVIDAMVD